MNNYCNAILYFSKITEKSETIQVKSVVDQCKGIVKTMPGQASPKLLLVDYDPGKARISDIIETLEGHGIYARAVGL